MAVVTVTMVLVLVVLVMGSRVLVEHATHDTLTFRCRLPSALCAIEHNTSLKRVATQRRS